MIIEQSSPKNQRYINFTPNSEKCYFKGTGEIVI